MVDASAAAAVGDDNVCEGCCWLLVLFGLDELIAVFQLVKMKTKTIKRRYLLRIFEDTLDLVDFSQFIVQVY